VRATSVVRRHTLYRERLSGESFEWFSNRLEGRCINLRSEDESVVCVVYEDVCEACRIDRPLVQGTRDRIPEGVLYLLPFGEIVWSL
jgi:hypothetical protein